MQGLEDLAEAILVFCRSRVSLLPERAETTLREVGGQRIRFYYRGSKLQKAPEQQTAGDIGAILAFLLGQLVLGPAAAAVLRTVRKTRMRGSGAR